MDLKILTDEKIDTFRIYLIHEEKSVITTEKYHHDVWAFAVYAKDMLVTKEVVLTYKQMLVEQYAVRSINSKLASHSFIFLHII